MRSVSIFGATGSIGQTTLDVISQQADDIEIKVLTGNGNVALLAKQAQQFKPKTVVIADESKHAQLQQLLSGLDISVQAGRDAILQAARIDVDWVMSAVVGFAGFEISLIAAQHCKTLALANKESLVCGGPLLRKTCDEHATNLLPVDSEHSAILQCLNGENLNTVERVIITASGGPFRKYTLKEMRDVDASQAAAHPNWSMGQRISIDSASMFNKAMEVIEAKELFDLSNDQIEVLVHPQSIVHSIVGFNDGNMIAQLGPANMAGAIGYALNWPERAVLDQPRLSAKDLVSLDFSELDDKRFPAVSLARRAIDMGGLSGAVFNAAKEQALDLFLAQRIGFLDMATLVERALDHYMLSDWSREMSLANIQFADETTREFVQNCLTEDVA
ncbi:1-deoxy-D-xylulose-5-phosphate reductoisomerase [Amylibacter kogurei]|uniref:1-deoxy-D-xylulose 5-phosphate reductoisomerase n=1 Tax=Paramylibacter kogurei TaxID=1889778 RepID=A0A2G5K6L6_9RHOB|nr:1-deoxy-D-xylulose-5-phosphate reductoisomerase [Amylibacter kogurei]PIB24652.1 1-deoxy-D-xylulose-5-phosphate reductoisomerase [Amylibacter kogurei]